MLHRFAVTTALLVGLMSASGCATVFDSSVQEIEIDSEPKGASVKIDGDKKGETPMSVELDAVKNYEIEVSKQGYAPFYRTLRRKASVGWVVVDIVMGGWPLLIDYATSDLYSFENDRLYAKLEERTPDAPDSDASPKELFERAAKMYKRGDYEDALRNFKAAHRRAPSPVLLYNIALTHSKMGQPERVLATARKIDNPDDLSKRYRAKLSAMVKASRVAVRSRQMTDDGQS